MALSRDDADFRHDRNFVFANFCAPYRGSNCVPALPAPRDLFLAESVGHEDALDRRRAESMRAQVMVAGVGHPGFARRHSPMKMVRPAEAMRRSSGKSRQR